jgi:hypothetical protein
MRSQLSIILALLLIAIAPLSGDDQTQALTFSSVVAPSNIILSSDKSNVISILIALKAMNTGSTKPILLDKHWFLVPYLETLLGEKIPTDWGIDGIKQIEYGDFTFIRPHYSTYISQACSLEIDNKHLILRGEIQNGGFWKIKIPGPGKYKLRLNYQAGKSQLTPELKKRIGSIEPWIGGIMTDPVDFIVQ